LGVADTVEKVQGMEQTDDCHDTKTQEAWIAKKNGELRCFLEQRSFPHRVKGSSL